VQGRRCDGSVSDVDCKRDTSSDLRQKPKQGRAVEPFAAERASARKLCAP